MLNHYLGFFLRQLVYIMHCQIFDKKYRSRTVLRTKPVPIEVTDGAAYDVRTVETVKAFDIQK